VCVILDERFKPLKRISFDCATFGTRFNTPVFIIFVAEIVISFVSFSSREYFVSSPPEEDKEEESEATNVVVVVFPRGRQKVPLLLLLKVILPPLRHKQQLVVLVVVLVKVAENALIENM